MQYSEIKRKKGQKNMSGNEMLFYGGITVFICSGIAAVISFGALKLKAIRLHAKKDSCGDCTVWAYAVGSCAYTRMRRNISDYSCIFLDYFSLVGR